ncbi:tail fiber assembly protein [Limnobaculum parvum]|uniref:Tail fiber assembly protein n=1 Tax=Limnobaculum parvum TaxID=2172103 RepID=A0A2Y9TX61_9GAMM|nr:tail fiber assembly protein [Limnobaculum parvum]AWH88014.1 tail fiber assembly protein [Limnobaculum parvum]
MNTLLDKNGLATSDIFIYVYNVNPVTNEYIYSTYEFLNQGIGLPAYSYIEKPLPEKAGFAICRGESGWEYIADFRNQVVYSIETGEELNVTELGSLANNVTIFKPKTAFDKWHGSSWVTDSEALHKLTIVQIKEKKYQLESIAKEMIEKLSDAIELDMALPDDTFKLKEWRKYRVLLDQIDINSPHNISWPLPPAK